MARGERVRAVSLLPVWTGLLAGPVAWVLHLFVSYLLVPVACDEQTRWPLHVLTLVLALVAGAASLWAYWAWRQTGVGGETQIGGPGGRSGFLALVGVLISALFFVVILAEGVPSVYLNPCR